MPKIATAIAAPEVQEKSKTINIVIQSKGGVGKSFIASLIAQLFKETGQSVKCIDTDPLTPTFTRIKGLEVEHLQVMTKNGSIDAGIFDDLVDRLAYEDDNFVIDSGASNFVEFVRYLRENKVVQTLERLGKNVVFHVVIVGGEAHEHSLVGMDAVIEQTKSNNIVVWLNDNFGMVEAEKPFTEMELYKIHKDRIMGIVRLPQRQPETFGKDVNAMTKAHLTFAEAIVAPSTRLASQGRLDSVRSEIFDQIKALGL